jgi:signal transduction histidine kinase
MYSPEQFVDITNDSNTDRFIATCWESLALQWELQASLLVYCTKEGPIATPGCELIKPWSIAVQSAFNVPSEPFNGAEREHVEKALEECFRIHPKPHVHALRKDDSLATRICRFNRNLKEQNRLWFVPLRKEYEFFVFLGFPEPGKGESLPKDLLGRLGHVLVGIDACFQARRLQDHLGVTERFVKEVGHDIASSVQATVAKLRGISEKRFTGDTIIVKAREAEQEIWDTYRVAESLGIAVDPNYQLKQQEDFDLCIAVEKVLRQFSSEASERHIKLKYSFSHRPVKVWGEESAVVQAIAQLISNAIKYSFGGQDVSVDILHRREDIVIKVTDVGIGLPEGADLKRIWDFGFRGQAAKERHVNGSGIGLYTVKKIVTAHHGWVEAVSERVGVVFRMHLPTEKLLKKDFGLLV